MSNPAGYSPRLLVILGPTASGKTARAVSAARKLGGEIISADSRQIYTGMDLGTGKDLEEYGDVSYHLIDIRPAGYRYTLYEYLSDYHRTYDDITSRGRLPILCGGTGLYIESVLQGLRLPEVPADPDFRESMADVSLDELARMLSQYKRLHNTTDIDTPKRAIRALEIERYYAAHPEAAEAARPHPVDNATIVGIDIPREARRTRIERRLRQRLDAGMIDEVRALIASGVTPDQLLYYGLEYKFLTLYVTGRLTLDDMIANLLIAIHQFAKRQMTWFRGMERRGFVIHWLPYDMDADEFDCEISSLLQQ